MSWLPAHKLALAATSLLLAVTYLAAGPAAAEQSGRAGVVVSLDGSTSPNSLPRDRRVPVTLALSGTIGTTDGAPLPRLDRIRIALASRGTLSTRGLPLCPQAELRTSDTRHALRACGAALVGRGSLLATLHFPGQASSILHANLLAFNGRSGGRPAVWVHAYSASPPVSFVLPFHIRRLRAGAYGILLRAPVGNALGRWPRLLSFRITLGRRYRAAGVRRSYLSANCPLPPRFHIGFFPLARASYLFAPTPAVTTTILRGCRVRR